MKNSRTIAVKILQDVIVQKHSLSTALAQKDSATTKDWPLIQELCFGTLRWFQQLNFLLQQLLTSPLNAKNSDIFCLLLVGLYQLLYMKIPPHAAVSETVETTKQLKKSWATALTNKILRRFLREKEALLALIEENNVAKFSHPLWLINTISQDWPDAWQTILQANNTYPPLFLRVNLQKISKEDYLLMLENSNIGAENITSSPTAIQLLQPLPVDKIPGFSQGHCSIQDLAGQRVIEKLSLSENLRVLDACAAPGSKTCHLLETDSSLTVVAIDKDKQRINKIRENLQRLQLTKAAIKIHAVDVLEIEKWWDQELFDRILADVPCSATGVIRRHPDIKILRRPEDISALIATQQAILKSLWSLLKIGGIFVYTTCSIINAENEEQIFNFLKTHTDAELIASEQILPSIDGADGFYYAVIKRMAG